MLRKLKQWAGGLPAVFLALAMALAGSACSNQDEADVLSPQEAAALQQRVWQRWQTIIARDFEKTWEFETPNYRSIFSKRMYAKKFSYGIEWELTDVEVLHYDGRAAVASVVARVMTESTKQTSEALKALGKRALTVREKWILIDGEWWHVVNS